MKLFRRSIPTLKSNSKESKKQWRLALAFIGPSFLGVCIFVLVPFLDVICRSFLYGMGTGFAGVDNYRSVVTNEVFQLAARNTAYFMAACIPLMLMLSLLLSVALLRIRIGRSLLRTIFLLPYAVPVASATMLWKVLFYDKGILNGFLHTCGIATVDWMDSGAAFWMLVISYLWKNLGYFIVLWLAGLMAISPDWYEAASIDGAGMAQQFRYITLPNLSGTIRMNVVLAIVNSFKVFREAYLVAGNYPEQHIYLLQHLFNNWFSQLDMEKMSAAAVLLMLVATCFIVWVNHRENRIMEGVD